MDVFTAIKERRSIRKYKDQLVEEEKLARVLEAARLSPSAKNRQNWHFIAVRDEGARGDLTKAIGQDFVGEAPVILVACGSETNSQMKGGQYRYSIDLAIATAYMILTAHEEGLGTCWLGSYDEDAVKEVLNIPEDMRVVAITPLGYPDESPEPRPRKPIEEIVSYDKF